MIFQGGPDFLSPPLDPPVACIWKKVLVWNVPFSVWWSSDAKSDYIITLGMLVCPWSGMSDDLLDINCFQTLIADRKVERERERDCTVFAHECLGQSINLVMRTQNPNLSCAWACVRQSRTFHSINALRTFYRKHTFLNWRNITIRVWSGSKPCLQMLRERERDWCRHIKVNIASADWQVERERDVCVCVCSFWISPVWFFYSGNSFTYFKVLCRSLQKNLIVRDV